MQGNITDWGKEVKKGLIERGWSINDLAERIGKSRTRVSGVVNGRIYSDSIASAISDLLNIEKASASMKEATRDWCMDARKAMIDLDMNTEELAEKTGYSTQYLNAIICGRCYSPPEIEMNVEKWTDRKFILDHVEYQLVNAERNAEKLKDIPGKKIADLVAIYRVVVGLDEDGMKSYVLTNAGLARSKISLEELDEAAKKNTEKSGFCQNILSSSECDMCEDFDMFVRVKSS